MLQKMFNIREIIKTLKMSKVPQNKIKTIYLAQLRHHQENTDLFTFHVLSSVPIKFKCLDNTYSRVYLFSFFCEQSPHIL